MSVISLSLHTLAESLLPKNQRLRVEPNYLIAFGHEGLVFREMYDFIRRQFQVDSDLTILVPHKVSLKKRIIFKELVLLGSMTPLLTIPLLIVRRIL